MSDDKSIPRDPPPPVSYPGQCCSTGYCIEDIGVHDLPNRTQAEVVVRLIADLSQVEDAAFRQGAEYVKTAIAAVPRRITKWGLVVREVNLQAALDEVMLPLYATSEEARDA